MMAELRRFTFPRIDQMHQDNATKTVSQSKRSSSLPAFLNVRQPKDLLAKQNIKTLLQWFKAWRVWQRRILICQVIEQCSVEGLESLATALEPTLHLDFSTTLAPPIAALHLDGAAMFQVQRRCLANSQSQEQEPSFDCLSTVPTTLLASSNSQESRTVDSPTYRKRTAILPAIPLTHVRHATLSATTELEDSVALRRQRFSSVPNFQSTSSLLRQVRVSNGRKTRHRRTRSLDEVGGRKGMSSRAAIFRTQMKHASQWMEKWAAPQKLLFILELVKFCDKDLLGYLVQCLYQRMQHAPTINSLPNDLLLQIFSYLDPKHLYRSSQVCKRWYHLCSTPQLWLAHCSQLGAKEGIGDLVGAVQMCYSVREGGKEEEETEPPFIDWKRTFRDLFGVMSRIKAVVLKAAAASAEKPRSEIESAPVCGISSTALKSSLSLRQMIDLVRQRSPCSAATATREVVNSAPESASVRRKRLRAERQALQDIKEEEEKRSREASKYLHRRPFDRSGILDVGGVQSSQQHSMLPVTDRVPTDSRSRNRESPVALIEVALDKRPSAPMVPNPDGIQCLILSGHMMEGRNHKAGKILAIPKLRRLQPFGSTILCIQCDQRKIVAGTEDRVIHVHDMRSGRYLHTLEGHKGSVQCLQFDERVIVSGSWDTTCIVWDVVHFSPIEVLTGHRDCVTCLQFDEEKLVTGSKDASIRIWCTNSWDCMTIIGSAHKGGITCLSLVHSTLVTGAADKSVKVWSLPSARCTAVLQHSAPITTLQLSRMLLVAASADGSVCLWNISCHGTGPASLLMQLSVNKEGGGGGGGHLTSLSLKNGIIFGAGSDAVIYEWDIATGTCMRTLLGHSQPLTSIWADQQRIVTASKDSTVAVWYTKKGLAMDDGIDPAEQSSFVDVPIRVVTL